MAEMLVKMGGKDPDGNALGVGVTDRREVKTKPQGTLTEVFKKINITVEPGKTFIIDKVPIYSDMFFYTIQGGGNDPFTVTIQMYMKDPDSVESYSVTTSSSKQHTDNYYTSDRRHVKGDRLWLSLKNDSSQNKTYRVTVWGVL